MNLFMNCQLVISFFITVQGSPSFLRAPPAPPHETATSRSAAHAPTPCASLAESAHSTLRLMR